MTRAPTGRVGAGGGVAMAAVAATCAWPVVALGLRGLSLPAPSTMSLADRLRAADLTRVAGATLLQALLSTALCLVLGVPLGVVVGRRVLPGHRLISAVMLAPFVLPSVVVGAAFVAAFPTWPPLALIIGAHAAFNVGLVARLVAPAVAAMHPDLLDAARSLGAPNRGVALVVLAVLRARILGAAAVVFSLCATSFGVVLVAGGGRFRTSETEIWYQTTRALDLRVATVIAVVQSLVVLPLVLARSRGFAVTPSVEGGDRRHRASGGLRVASACLVAVCLALVAVPLVRLVVSSLELRDGGGETTTLGLDNYRSLGRFGAGTSAAVDPLGALGRSVVLAAIAAAAVTVVATWAATTGGRASGTSHGSATSRLRDAVIMFPAAISGATLGLGLLVGYGRPPVDLRGGSVLVVAAEFAVALPLAYRIVGDARATFPGSQLDAARDLGASTFAAWRTVMLPQIAPAVAAAAGLAFAIGLGEVAAASFVARTDRPTLPVLIARLLGRVGPTARGQAMAASCLLGATCLIVWVGLGLVGRSGRRGVTRGVHPIAR